MNKPLISKKRFIFYFVTLAALVVIYLKFSELRLIGHAFLGANRWWLLGIIIAQILSYLSLALNYHEVLKMKDTEIGHWNLFPMTFAIQFLNQAIPSATISGQIFFIQYLRRYGLSIVEGIGRAILEILTLFIGFGLFFFVAAILLVSNDDLTRVPLASIIVYFFLLISILCIVAFIMFQKRGRGKISNWFLGFVKKVTDKFDAKNSHEYFTIFVDQIREHLSIKELNKKKKSLWLAVMWQAMILFLNVLTVYFISYAIGSSINFTVAFVAFTLTKFISMIAFVPGGFGVFEGGMTLILISFGVPAGPALAITLVYRGFSFWLPMPVGWLIYRYYTHREELENLEM